MNCPPSLAIGIDDMFVIMRCLENIPEEERRRRGPAETLGLTMRSAGASVTVTTLTDVCAFATGAMTTFPSLQSFCVTAAFSIAAIYLLQGHSRNEELPLMTSLSMERF